MKTAVSAPCQLPPKVASAICTVLPPLPVKYIPDDNGVPAPPPYRELFTWMVSALSARV
jgi:hypothetical protein